MVFAADTASPVEPAVTSAAIAQREATIFFAFVILVLLFVILDCIRSVQFKYKGEMSNEKA